MKKVLPSNNNSTKIDKPIVDGVDITDHKGINDSLNSYFTSIATDLLSDRNSSSTFSTSCSNPHNVSLSQFSSYLESSPFSQAKFQFRSTTEDEIYKLLTKFKPNKTTGNDNIPAKVVKLSSRDISQSLYCIVNSILETGIFLNKWKTVIISSIFKRNLKTNRDNYRQYLSCPASLR